MSTARRPHLLLVDQDDSRRSELQNDLADFYSVVTEPPDEEALDFICSGHADLAILNLDAAPDVIIDMIETVRDNAILDSIPLVVMMGESQAEAGAQCANLGADAVLTRPVSTDALCERIDALLASVSGL